MRGASNKHCLLTVFHFFLIFVMSIYPYCANRNKSRLLFSSAEMFKKPMANSVDPDQTAPIGAVCSGSTLFASILNCQ